MRTPGRRRRRINLTEEEILVLFEVVHRWEGDDARADTIRLEHPGEREALRRLGAALAPEVDGVFGPHYAAAVAQARAALAGPDLGRRTSLGADPGPSSHPDPGPTSGPDPGDRA